MKVLILLGLVAATCADFIGISPTYNIIERELIPLGEKIRKAEENNVNQRIIGGSAAVLGQFPFQVGTLTSYQGISGTGICGGSLVSPNRVIYAAHCWFDGMHQGWLVTVAAGTITIFSGGVRFDTSSIAMHPNWTPMLASNDVAVIYLPQSFTFSATIAPIALPSPDLVGQTFAGAVGTASGFGLTSQGGSIPANAFLSHVSLNIMSNMACSLSFPFIINPGHICTSGASITGTCQGDSGGPLTVVSGGQPLLIGITSFGSVHGCESGNPAVFARVTHFLDFFNQHL